MKRSNFILITILLFLFNGYSFAEEYLIVFASNLESFGGTYREDNTGADLFSVIFDSESQQVSSLKRLTSYQNTAEWFPSISPDAKWIAYNFQQGSFNEVHLLNLATGADTAIVSDARFPEWINDSELLVSKKTAGRSDIFKVTLNLSDTAPKVVSVERKTDPVKCPNTSMAEDPYPFPDGGRFIFHTLRSSLPHVPAAIATINSSGTGFSFATDWNGSGHGIVSKDGTEIICSIAGSGESAVIDISTASVTTTILPLSNSASDYSEYDSRFSNEDKVHWTYAAWSDTGNSLLFSVQGSSVDNVFSFSRLFRVQFNEDWNSPEIFDFSSAVEVLAGKSGKDFCTASSRKLPLAQTEVSMVYVNIFLGSGNPENSNYPDFSLDENREEYIRFRTNLINFCEMLHSYNVSVNWMTNWNFLNGVLKWEDSGLMAETNGKNVVRYISEDLEMCVGAHCHENMGYNYADNCCLIDSLGVTPSNVVGGHIFDPDDPYYQNWEKFRQPLQGEMFPHYFWKGDILTLHATGQHVNDPELSGVWKPKDKDNFRVHDSLSEIYAIGQYKNNFQGILELVNLRKSGAVPAKYMLTGSINLAQSQLDSQFVRYFESNILYPLLDMQEKGEVKIVTYNQVIDVWKNMYDSTGFVYNPPEQSYVSEEKTDDFNFILGQNYPNPFNSFTKIQYRLSDDAGIKLTVYDMAGRCVRTLEQGRKKSGDYSVVWDARDDWNRIVSSGVYFYNLEIDNRLKDVKKMILIK